MANDDETTVSSGLPDGHFDVLVVEAERVSDITKPGLSLQVVVTAGEHKGEVLDLRMSEAEGTKIDPLDLLALPCDLVVVDGMPRLELP